MRYFVIEDDELSECGEEMIYVFEHTKRNNNGYGILSLEDFAAKCMFIEMRNRHMYWYEGKGMEDTTVDELEKRIRAEQKELKPLSKEEYITIRNHYSSMITPFNFPSLNQAIKSAYAFEPEWNEEFFVMETDDIYFGVYWFTSA